MGKIMRWFAHEIIGEDVFKDLTAKRVQQLVLSLKMSVKGTAPNVCGIKNILHRNLFISFVLQEKGECCENGISRLFLSSIHIASPPYKIRNLFRNEHPPQFVCCIA